MTRISLESYSRSSFRARRRSRFVRGALALTVVAVVIGTAAALVVGLPFPKGVPGGDSARPADAETTGTARGGQPAPAGQEGGDATVVPIDSTPAEPSGPATLTVAAAGDMIFDRKVGALVRRAGGEAPLSAVAYILARADIAVANLESPLSSAGKQDKDKDVTFRGEPAAIEGLKRAGFDFLSLANNHALDYGPDALADTVSLLDSAGIGYAGAGRNREAAWKPAVVERDGASVAFLSFSHILPPGFIAGSNRAGIAQGRANMDAVVDAIRDAKDDYDYVIVSFHWGVEYADHANGDQVHDAHRAVDAGADTVLSHHPHVIQGVERYEGALIAYSTGDFVFDHYSRKTGEAFIIEAQLGPSGVGDVKFTPVYLDGDGRPDIVTGSEASVILKRLRDISAPLGGKVKIRGDTAVLR